MRIAACISALIFLTTTAHAEVQPAPNKPGPGVVATADAPAAIGPYSQAIDTGSMLFVSGQLGLRPSGEMAGADTAAQARQSLENIRAILSHAGLTMDDVVQTQIYVVDLNEFTIVNQIYAGFFKRPPARATVQVARLPRDGRVEIAAIAVRPVKHRH